jgi:hypothetical protein
MKRTLQSITLILLLGATGWAKAATVSITGSPLMDQRVDLSIERGLAYLASNQGADGGWGTVGVSGLCGMAFLAKGYLPGDDKYGDNIERTIDYMLSTMSTNGLWSPTVGGYMYSHGIATLFLTEVSGMLSDEQQERVDEMLPKALQVMLSAQGNDGGWAYAATKGSHDLSISGWQLMALRSAKHNGAPIPLEAIQRSVKYVLKHNDAEKGTFGYMDRKTHALTLTGAGILCLELCGEHGNPVIAEAGKYLTGVYRKLPEDSHSEYGLYYTSQGLFQIGGPTWKGFSKWMYEFWIPKQNKNGSFGGEQGWTGENDPIYKTAMTVLAFAVPYRMLPIYQRDETVDEKE